MRFLLLVLSLSLFSCGGTKQLPLTTAFPIITLQDDYINVGDLEHGKSITILYAFTNTGDADLFIELVTACKCTSIDWTRGNIAPGEKGEIYVSFDSTGFSGEIEKTIDIISNVEAIVVEVHFKANVINQ